MPLVPFRTAVFAAVFAVSAAAPVSAQESDLSRYWDALQSASTITALPAVPSPVTGDMRSVATALRAIREYELTWSKATSATNVGNLYKLVEAKPNNAWAHFALGTALVRGPDVHVHWVNGGVSYDTYKKFSNAGQRAPKELQRALDLDPEMMDAAVELGAIGLHFEDRTLQMKALHYLEHTDLGASPTAFKVADQLSRKTGIPVSFNATSNGRNSSGTDKSIMAFGRAMGEFSSRTGQKRGAVAYMEGIDNLTPAGSVLYFDNIRFLLSESETKQWTTLSLPQRAEMLRRFWTVHAALAGVPLERRLSEHFARINSAESALFRRANAAVNGPSSLSEVARVMMESTVRHGGTANAQKHLYCPAGWDTLPEPEQPTLQSCMCSSYGRYIDKKLGLPPCGSLHMQIPGRRWDAMDAAAARQLAHQAERRVEKGESYYPKYRIHAAVSWEALQFRAPDGSGAVFAVMAMAYTSVAALTESTSSVNGTLSLLLIDTAAALVNHGDTTVTFARNPSSFPPSTFAAVVAAPPSSNALAVRLRVENAAFTGGRIVYGGVKPIDFTVGGLSMSDIVFGADDDHGTFKRGSADVPFSAGQPLHRTTPVGIYYEIYGNEKNDSVTTNIRVEHLLSGAGRIASLFTGGPNVIDLTFTDKAPVSVPLYGIQESRKLDIGTLTAGSYRVVVTIRAAGKITRNERTIEVIE